MHRKTLAALALSTFGFISGCSSEDAALRAAIEEKVAKEGNSLACASVLNSAGSFPMAYHADGMLNYGADKNTLDQLVKDGFLSSKPVKVKSVYGGLNGETVGSPQAIEYSLTPVGKKYARANQFCVPTELADTKIETDGSKRSLLVTQYFAAEKTPETERLSSILAKINPQMPKILDEELPLFFTVKKTIKEDIVSIEKLG